MAFVPDLDESGIMIPGRCTAEVSILELLFQASIVRLLAGERQFLHRKLLDYLHKPNSSFSLSNSDADLSVAEPSSR